MSKTLGENRVRTDFNVAEGADKDRVFEIKQRSAKLINICEDIKHYDATGEERKEVSNEQARLVALAQTAYEEAAMWAVKAATA